ncbi:HelD family protein [Nocardiopsis metallicus]|uniref:DNA helicase IV n=1 Tax=Nocardiopsis metallicus TaxID=179819 RepID=A0A840VYP4_9ACTN|nr:AAA family ATPase [Nocardiopsis metallicus]MBB5489620.1 DNA helicase IV [Nocardiopsis metallicus]
MSAPTQGEHSREAVIAEEQEAVDHAYSCLERMRAATAKMVLDPGGANAKDSAELRREHQERLEAYDDLADKPLVFMRVDVSADDAGAAESFYVGRRNVVDEERERVVISWTSEAAVRWRQARQSDPGDVRLRRVLHCERQHVRGFHDEIHRARPSVSLAGRSSLDASASSVPADTPEALDPFLARELDLARDGRMRDIVETIQREQLDLVADDRPGALMVQGGPGTGKTAVGLHRVTWLLDNRGWRAQDVLVVGPHQDFLDFVSTVLPSLGSRGVRTMELSRIWGTGAAPHDTGPRARVKSDLRMAELLRRAVEDVVRPERLEDFVEYGAFTISGGGMSAGVEQADLQRSLEVALARPGSLRYQRDEFHKSLVTGLSARVIRSLSKQEREDRGKEGPHCEGPDRGLREETVVDSRLRAWAERHPRVDALLKALWPLTDEERILRRLFGDRAVLAKAARDLFSEEEQRHLLNKPRTKVVWSQEDRVCLEELRFLVRGERPRRYRHIVLDEAQDLTPMQARSLAQRCPDGSMTVLGDLAQATGPHKYATWGDFARSLGAGQWHTAELLVGYRVPRQIMEFAAPIARRHAPGVEVPRSIRAHGADALTLRHTAPELLLEELERRLWELEAVTGDQRSIAVIIPEDAGIFVGAEEVAEAVAARGRNARLVRVLNVPEVNGLEFDHVVVVEPAAIVGDDQNGLGSLYVALTRSTQSLSVIHARPLPAELVGGESERGPSAETSRASTAEFSEVVARPGEPERGEPERRGAGEGEGFGAPSGLDGLRSLIERGVEHERGSELRQRLWCALMLELHGRGHAPEHDGLVDALCTGPDGDRLFHVLGEDGHTYEGMRQGALRAKEVAHVHGTEADTVCLVLPKAPEQAGAVEAVREMFGILVIWRAGRRWAGPDVFRVLH